jgi:ribosomal protein L4
MQKKGIKIEMALSNDIAFLQKDVVSFLNKANSSDAKIQKLVQSLNAEAKFFLANKNYAKIKVKEAQSLGTKFEAMAKELGVAPNSLEPAKNLNVVLDSLKQIDDTITNIVQAIATVGK